MLPSQERNLPYWEPMDPDQIARIDNASMAILEDVGVVFRDEIALEDWRKAGAIAMGLPYMMLMLVLIIGFVKALIRDYRS